MFDLGASPLRSCAERLRHGATSRASFRNNSFLALVPTFGLGLAAPTLHFVATTLTFRHLSRFSTLSHLNYFCYSGYFGVGRFAWDQRRLRAHCSEVLPVSISHLDVALQAAFCLLAVFYVCMENGRMQHHNTCSRTIKNA